MSRNKLSDDRQCERSNVSDMEGDVYRYQLTKLNPIGVPCAHIDGSFFVACQRLVNCVLAFRVTPHESSTVRGTDELESDSQSGQQTSFHFGSNGHILYDLFHNFGVFLR